MGYFALITIPTVFVWAGDKLVTRKEYKKMLYFIGFFSLILITASRFELGADYEVYENAYYAQSSSWTELVNFDLLFAVFMKIPSMLQLNFHWFLFISSTINYFLLFKTLKYYNQDEIWFQFLIYLLFFGISIYSLSAMRQSFTIHIHMYCMKYVDMKMPLKYLIGTIIGGLFHWSGFVLLPLYYVYSYLQKKGITINTIFFIMISILYFSLDKLFVIFKPYMNYNLYFYFFIEKNVASSKSVLAFLLTIMLVFFIYFIFSVKKVKFSYEKLIIYFSKMIIPNYCIATCIYIVLKILQFIQYQNVLPRFQMYFYCFIPFLIYYIEKTYIIKKFKFRIIVISILIIMFCSNVNESSYYSEYKMTFDWIINGTN